MSSQTLDSGVLPFYQLSRFIDAKDSVNKWCTAKVIQIDDSALTIRFDGWSSKWDERVSLKSTRIAPFRRHSHLYGGQHMTAIREWSFSLEELARVEQRILSACESGLAFESAYEATQFLRGDLFTLVDCLLTNTYQGPEVPQVLSFFTRVIDLVIAYLNLPDVFKWYAQGAANPDLFLTDVSVAVAMSYEELFFTLERLMAGEQRTSQFFTRYTEAPRDYEPVPDTTWSSRASKVMQFFANYFARKGGFKVVLEVIRRDSKLPLEVLARLPVNLYARFLQGEKLTTFVGEWKAAVLSRLQNLGEKDIKDFDKEVCVKILTSLGALVQVADRNASIDFVDTTEMTLALTLLKCQFLEKRIRGLNEFRELIQRTVTRNTQGNAGQRRVSKSKLIDFITSQNLLLTIIADRPHAEIVRRSGEVFAYFAENGLLSQSHLDILWASRCGKHDTYVRAVYQVLITISSVLNSDLKDSLFQRFSEVPIDQYDEKYLRVLKDFSQNAVVLSNPKVRSDVTNDFALPKFFSLMLDDPKTQTSLSDLSTDLLLDLLKSPSFRGRQDEYLELALDNVINRRESVPQSLRLVLGILRPANSTPSRALSEQLKKLEKKFKLVQGAVDSLLLYVRTARQSPPSSPEAIVSGRYSHAVNLSWRFSFLEFVLEYNDRAKLTNEQISSLWEAFVRQPSCVWDSETFFNWLASNLEGRSTLSKEAQELLFDRFFCNISYPITSTAFSCFSKFFLYLNAQKKRIETRGTSAVVQRQQCDIAGFMQLLEIALKTDNESISEKAMKLIVDLYLRLGRSAQSEKDRIWSELLSRLVNCISVTKDSRPTIVLRVLKVFNLCLDEAEGKASCKSAKNGSGESVKVFFKRMADTEFRRFQLPVTATIGDVRRKIAEMMQVAPNFVFLSIMNRTYGRVDDEIELSTFLNSITVLIDISRSISDLVDPKPLLANHPELLNTLFDVIALPHPETAELAWTLLMRLPMNDKIKGPIRRLEPNWFRVLSTTSLHRLLYCLIIIDELSDESGEFAEAFKEKKGISHIVRVFFESRLEEQHSSALTLKYALVVFRLLAKFLPPQGYEPDSIINRTLSLLLEISNSLLTSTEYQPEAVETVRYASELLSNVISKLGDKHTAVINILEYRHMDELLAASLLKAKSSQFREGMKSLLITLSRKLGIETEMLSFLLELLPRSLMWEDSGSPFFQLAAKLVKDANESLAPRFREMQTLLIADLKMRKCEKSAADRDEVLSGSLTVLRAVIKKLSDPIQDDLVSLILHNCLFEVPTAGKLSPAAPPKCKNIASRTEALKLLATVTTRSSECLREIVTYLDKLHQDPHWRTARKQDWNVHQATMERSETGFVGIKNLGCTCYMGSILQQLFMVETFREGILAVESSQQDEDLLYQLQNVFAALKESDKQYINPKALTKTFKFNEGQAFNAMEQMDVDEFFNNFMDKLEAQIKSAPQSKTLIQDHFGGLQTTELIGKGSCSHRSERVEPFLVLPLEVKNKKSIYESLDSFVAGEVLEGDNAYQCDHCEAKVTAARRVCIQHLPNMMIFALRRFDFNLDTMSRLKLNDYWEFPMEIDLEPYTVEGLNRKDAMSEAEQSEVQPIERKYPNDYYQYKLRGVVIHMGTAESGHYYSFITDGQGKWFEFNDTQVRELDPKDIPAEAFGGEERWNVSSPYGAPVVSLREKYRNAYLLFYERSGVYQRRAPDEDTLTALRLDTQLRHSSTAQQISQQVIEDNEKFWSRRNAFCHEYFDFLLKLGKLHPKDVTLMKFTVSFFLIILIRSKDRHRIEDFYRVVREGLMYSTELSHWMLEVLSVEQVIEEFFLNCPEAPMRKIVVSLAKFALRSVSSEQQTATAVRLLRVIGKAKKPNSRHFAQFFEMIEGIVAVNHGLWDELQISTRLLAHLLDDVTQPLPDLPTPAFTYSDIYLGYTDGKTSEAVTDKFAYAIYEAGSGNTYIYKALSRFPEKLSEEEVQRYFAHKPSMTAMVRDATTKVGSRSLGSLYAFLCKDSPQLSKDYCVAICTAISEFEFDHHKPLYRQLLYYLKIRDEFAGKRTEHALATFLEQMKDNINYIRATETSLDFLYKLQCSVPQVQEAFASRRLDLKFLEDWMKRAQNYGLIMPTVSNMTMYKQKPAGTANARPTLDKIDLAKKLIKGEAPALSYVWDSDEEFSGRELHPGDRVEVINIAYMRWDRAVVLQCFGEIVQVRLDFDKSVLWVERDGDMIAGGSRQVA